MLTRHNPLPVLCLVRVVTQGELPKRMKEQQKINCNCNACIRRRITVEEELNALYDWFVQDLEDRSESIKSSQRELANLAAGESAQHPGL
jgi:hypothetical protein